MLRLLLRTGPTSLDGVSVLVSRPCCRICTGDWGGEQGGSGSMLWALASLCGCKTVFSLARNVNSRYRQRVDFVQVNPGF